MFVSSTGTGNIIASTSVPTQVFMEYASVNAVYIANQLMAAAKYIDTTHIGAGALAGELGYGYCIVLGVW